MDSYSVLYRGARSVLEKNLKKSKHLVRLQLEMGYVLAKKNCGKLLLKRRIVQMTTDP